MKGTLVIRKLAPFGVALLVGCLPLLGDENTAEPSYDAIAAAPGNHKIVFENEKVRVLEVTIKPGEKEPFHEHSMFSVMNIIAGAPLRITEATIQDGKLVTGKTIEVGKDNLQPPPLWMPPQGLHSAENVGSVTFMPIALNSRSRRHQQAAFSGNGGCDKGLSFFLQEFSDSFESHG